MSLVEVAQDVVGHGVGKVVLQVLHTATAAPSTPAPQASAAQQAGARRAPQPLPSGAGGLEGAAHLEGAHAGEDGLCAVAEDGQHGEAPVLELLGLQLLHLGLGLAQVEQVEELAACTGVGAGVRG